MKLSLIGGGGVRSPLFVMSLLRRVERLPIDELCLMDIDERKLSIFGALCAQLIKQAGQPFRLTTTSDARRALDGARHVVTTLRVGFENGRVLDEKIALQHGVLGQETTGPGGFAMALRSIPAILVYASLLQELSPGAWMYNFTNPAGLVSQALCDAGFRQVVGICDGANAAQHAAAHWLGVRPERLQAEVFGLNHLSWARRIWLEGEDVLPGLLANPRFVREKLGVFDPELVVQTGMFLNEYLYYYHSADQALQAIRAETKTRGEEILELNQQLLNSLEALQVAQHPSAGLQAFLAYDQRRGATYMHYAHAGGVSPEQAGPLAAGPAAEVPAEAGEGYAGVALGIVEGLESGIPLYTALNVPNESAIAGLRPSDVVEVSCRVDREGVHPLPIGEIPETQRLLVQTVKLYERLTVQAVRTRSKRTAVQALMVHPLVLSYARARLLVQDYLQAHAAYVGDWGDE